MESKKTPSKNFYGGIKKRAKTREMKKMAKELSTMSALTPNYAKYQNDAHNLVFMHTLEKISEISKNVPKIIMKMGKQKKPPTCCGQ